MSDRNSNTLYEGEPARPGQLVQATAELLRDPNWEVRLRAALLLQELGAALPETLFHLVGAILSDPRAEVADAAAQAYQALNPSIDGPDLDLDSPLTELYLSAVTTQSLQRVGIHTVRDLVGCSPQELLKVKSVDLDEVRCRLRECHLSLRPESD